MKPEQREANGAVRLATFVGAFVLSSYALVTFLGAGLQFYCVGGSTDPQSMCGVNGGSMANLIVSLLGFVIGLGSAATFFARLKYSSTKEHLKVLGLCGCLAVSAFLLNFALAI